MNKLILALLIMLGFGTLVFYLHKSRLLAGAQARYAALTTPRNFPAKALSCGCVADVDEQLPTTPQQIKQAKLREKREEAQGELRDKQTDNRVRRLIRVGMSRKQVEQIMGPASMMGSPDIVAKGNPSDDASFYSDYQIAYTAKDIVVSVRYDSR